MKLSKLQKYILKTVWEDKKPRVSREKFELFYNQLKRDKSKKSPPQHIRTNIITKSIERLIDKGLLVGFGEKTQHKLYIYQVKLTVKGKKIAQSLLGQQTAFKFRKTKKANQ